jgi:hypothetical protein
MQWDGFVAASKETNLQQHLGREVDILSCSRKNSA